MNMLNLKINKGLAAMMLVSLVLAACGGGSADSYSPKSGNNSITVPPVTIPPVNTTFTVFATPPVVSPGGTSVITWSSPNSTSCTSPDVPSGELGTFGTFTTPALATTTTYTVTCTGGTTGNVSRSVTVAVGSGAAIIAGVAAACANEAMPTGTVYYYCDCGLGAQNGCVAGADANVVNGVSVVNPGTDPLLPRRTIANAAARFSSNATNVTVALCKGGAFNVTASLDVGSNACGADVACNTLRDYTPSTFTNNVIPTAKPLLYNAAAVPRLFEFMGANKGGIRLLNLKLNDRNAVAQSVGVFLRYSAHDVTMCNLDIDGFDIAVQNADGDAPTSNIILTGSNITNSRNIGYLGGGNNTQINYNTWAGNGSQGIFNHAVYFSSNQAPVNNVAFIGNHVSGQFGSTCDGVVVTGHIPVVNFRVLNNTVEIAPGAATNRCWGIGFGSSGYAPRYLQNATISNNIVKNVGSVGLTVAECPSCVVENNLIIQNTNGYGIVGIEIGAELSATPANPLSSQVKVRNNTIWFGPSVTLGATGIAFRTAGTGHTVVNNTVTYSATLSSDPVFCFNYPTTYAIPGSAFTYFNYNHCASAATYTWAAGRDLAAWRTFSGFDMASLTHNSATVGGIPALFRVAGTDFRPITGSPLIAAGIGAGNTASVVVPALDIVGNPRPAPPAIGAYEP